MASAQGSAMAIAVSNAGGLGSLPCATLSIDQIRKELAAITAATSNPYNVTSSSIGNQHQTRRAKRRGARCWRRTTPSSA